MKGRDESSRHPRTRPAAFVKAHWRDVVADANAHGEVVITRHDRPEVVVLSMARYEQLQREASGNDPLATLRADFDRELAAFRDPGAGDDLRRAFAAAPDELSRAANATALESFSGAETD